MSESLKTPVRRFLVFADVRGQSHVEEFASGTPEDEIVERCEDTLDGLIGNGDTGWTEITEEEWKRYQRDGRL